MREIKFRAWFKEIKYMCYAAHDCYDSLGCERECGSWEISSFGDLIDREKTVLMQYTNLKDKDGKEIYEGDIVKALGFPDETDFGIWEVTYLKYGMRFDFVNKKFLCDMTGKILRKDEAYTVKVIGNRYETPKLLTKLNPDYFNYANASKYRKED